MLTKVYIETNAFELSLEILDLLYLKMRKEKHMFERQRVYVF